MELSLQLAEHIGRHAPSWYAATLALLLALGAGLWLRSGGGRPADDAAQRHCALAAGRALAAVLLTAGVYALIVPRFRAGTGIDRFDVRLAEVLAHALPADFLGVFARLTHVGDTLTITLVAIAVAVLLWVARQRDLALLWVVAISGNALLNVSLKALFERARPPFDASVASAAGWSFPSGHSSGTVVTFGMLAFLARRLLPPRWQLAALLAAVTLAFSVGVSRVLLRVHYFSDVVAGFCSGLAWLLLCIAVWHCATRAR